MSTDNFGDRPLSSGATLKEQICPQCGKLFDLHWEARNGEEATLIIRLCPSAGVYDVSVECPHCDYHEDL